MNGGQIGKNTRDSFWSKNSAQTITKRVFGRDLHCSWTENAEFFTSTPNTNAYSLGLKKARDRESTLHGLLVKRCSEKNLHI